MAARLGSARLFLSMMSARTLCCRPHVPLRTLVTSTPRLNVRPFVPPRSLEAYEEDGFDITPGVEGEEELTPEMIERLLELEQEDILQGENEGNEVLEEEDTEIPDGPENLQRPPSPAFYTIRPTFYDALSNLQDTMNTARATLKLLHLYPLPKFALDALPRVEPAWQDRVDMSDMLELRLSAGMHTQLITILQDLELYHRIAQAAGHTELAWNLGKVVGSFQSSKNLEARQRKLERQEMMRRPADLDDYGRSYTVGRRKTSTARVWMIKAPQRDVPQEQPETGSVSTLLSPTVKVPPPSTTSVLINSVPLAQYFVTPAQREAVLRPLKLAGLLGAYNIFALVRGGGTSGQSGALALAIAKGCASHVPDIQPIMKKADLLRRDPRMVERKKPGQPKARKKYAWVRR